MDIKNNSSQTNRQLDENVLDYIKGELKRNWKSKGRVIVLDNSNRFIAF